LGEPRHTLSCLPCLHWPTWQVLHQFSPLLYRWRSLYLYRCSSTSSSNRRHGNSIIYFIRSVWLLYIIRIDL